MSASLIFLSKCDLSASYLVFKKNPLISIFFTLVTNLSDLVALITSFLTTLLSLLQSIFKFFNFSTSIFSTSVFRVAKFDFSAKLEVSIRVAFFKSVNKSTLTLMFPLKFLNGLSIESFYTIYFLLV